MKSGEGFHGSGGAGGAVSLQTLPKALSSFSLTIGELMKPILS